MIDELTIENGHVLIRVLRHQLVMHFLVGDRLLSKILVNSFIYGERGIDRHRG